MNRTLRFQRQRNHIQPFQQHQLRLGINSKAHPVHRLRRQINVHGGPGKVSRWQFHRQQAVPQAIGLEDRREAGRDHGTDAPFGQRPHRMFAAGAAAEILPAQQDLRALAARIIEHKRRIGPPRIHIQIAPRRKQPIGQPGAPGGAHFPAGDDGIGVDIVAQQRDGHRSEAGEGRHANTLGSAITPASALATTVSGDAMWVRMPGPCRPSKLRLVLLIVRLPGGKPSPPA